jgi:hypothetical protein
MKKFQKQFATVFTDEFGFHRVMLPSGEVIPHDVKSVTIDRINYSEVTVNFLCNITTTKKEAINKYKK